MISLFFSLIEMMRINWLFLLFVSQKKISAYLVTAFNKHLFYVYAYFVFTDVYANKISPTCVKQKTHFFQN